MELGFCYGPLTTDFRTVDSTTTARLNHSSSLLVFVRRSLRGLGKIIASASSQVNRCLVDEHHSSLPLVMGEYGPQSRRELGRWTRFARRIRSGKGPAQQPFFIQRLFVAESGPLRILK